MNFQTARNSPGNFVQMQGTAVKFDIKSGEYGDYALGSITDNTGFNQKVFFAASDDSPLPDDSVKGQLANWGVKFDANKQKFKAYFNGYTQQQAQGHQDAAQSGSQDPQTPPQGTKAGQGVDYTAQFLQCATRLLDVMEHLTHATGTFTPPARPTQPSGPNPDHVGDDPEPPTDDIPF